MAGSWGWLSRSQGREPDRSTPCSCSGLGSGLGPVDAPDLDSQPRVGHRLVGLGRFVGCGHGRSREDRRAVVGHGVGHGLGLGMSKRRGRDDGRQRYGEAPETEGC